MIASDWTALPLTLILVLLAALAGAGLGRWWAQRQEAQRNAQQQLQWQARLDQQQQTTDALQAQLTQARDTTETLREERAQWQERGQRVPVLEAQLLSSQQDFHTAQREIAELQSRLAALETEHELGQQNAAEKLQFLEQAGERLQAQFQQLAQGILEEKTQRFTEQNQQHMGQLLDPLRHRLHEFQGRVEQFYDAEGKQRAALSQQVHDLMGLNRRLSDEAHNLTQALKGTTKTQGNWGEMLLERVLEQAGLRKGSDYELQPSFTLEDGRRSQPDLIVHLPQERHLVLDAKISLTAYERYVNLAQTSEDNGTTSERKTALRQHIESVRRHIRELSERNYQKLHRLQSLDFVVMFVPIEPAFMLAIHEDERLSQEAWERNVLLATPSTLLFVLRTIAHLWRQEAQTRNAQEIAKRGAELYDKLAAFVTEMEKVGQQLRMAQSSYDSALAKLSQQRGNVIRQAEMLKELGIRPSKSIPASVLLHAVEVNTDGDAAEVQATPPTMT